MQLVDPGEEMPPRAFLHVVRRALVGFSPYERSAAFAKLGMKRSGNASRPRNQVAIAVSYAAVVANASAARRRLVSEESRPVVRSSSRISGNASASRRRDVGEFFAARGHRRPADVDHLDRVRLGHSVARDDLREGRSRRRRGRWLDPVVVERGQVVRVVAARQDRRVDPRMERLDAAAEHLRDLGQLLHRHRVDPALREVLGGPAARDEIHAEVVESLRELDQPGLVPGG